MKLAIASQNRKQVTGHAGQCRNFWVFDIADSGVVGRALVELGPDQTFHSNGAGAASMLDGVDVFIAGGMGSGLRQRLAQRSMRTIITSETDIDRTLAAFLAGTLPDDRTGGADPGHHHAANHEPHEGGCGHCGCSHR